MAQYAGTYEKYSAKNFVVYLPQKPYDAAFHVMGARWQNYLARGKLPSGWLVPLEHESKIKRLLQSIQKSAAAAPIVAPVVDADESGDESSGDEMDTTASTGVPTIPSSAPSTSTIPLTAPTIVSDATCPEERAVAPPRINLDDWKRKARTHQNQTKYHRSTSPSVRQALLEEFTAPIEDDSSEESIIPQYPETRGRSRVGETARDVARETNRDRETTRDERSQKYAPAYRHGSPKALEPLADARPDPREPPMPRRIEYDDRVSQVSRATYDDRVSKYSRYDDRATPYYSAGRTSHSAGARTSHYPDDRATQSSRYNYDDYESASRRTYDPPRRYDERPRYDDVPRRAYDGASRRGDVEDTRSRYSKYEEPPRRRYEDGYEEYQRKYARPPVTRPLSRQIQQAEENLEKFRDYYNRPH